MGDSGVITIVFVIPPRPVGKDEARPPNPPPCLLLQRLEPGSLVRLHKTGVLEIR